MHLANAKLFINPAAGRWKGKKLASKIHLYLQGHGLHTDLNYTHSKGDLIKQVYDSVLSGHPHIIVAGGDGTIHEAVNGLMQARNEYSSKQWKTIEPCLGIIPIGTGNDFIKTTNIPKNIKAACDYLLTAKPRVIDIGHIHTLGHQPAYFINNVGAGFDGKIGLSAQKITFIRGFIVYVLALVWNLIKGIPNPHIEIQIDDLAFNQKMTLIAISNGTTYGGSFKIAPKALTDDGKLDCIVAPAYGRFSVIPLLIQLMRGKHLDNPNIIFKQAKSIICTSNESIAIIADGETIAEAAHQFEINIIERALHIL